MSNRPTTPADFQRVLTEMRTASAKALRETTPTPMIVGSPSTPLGNDVDPTKQTWFVAGGVCGNAWVKIANRGNFAKWLRQNDLAQQYSDGGLTLSLWARKGFADGGQSYEYNKAIAYAVAEVLRANGIEATVRAYID